MNERARHFGWTSITLPVAGITAILAVAATAAAGDPPDAATYTPAEHAVVLPREDGGGSRIFTAVRSGRDGDVEVSGHSVSVTVKNGEVTVLMDGKEVPASRIKESDDGIIVLDGDGNEIETIRIGQWQGGMIQMGVAGDGQFPRFGGRMMQIDPPRVMLGVHISVPGAALEYHLGLEPGATTMVTAVFDGLGADDAGLDPYDIITSIDGAEPADPASLHEALADLEAGDTIRFGVIHKGAAKRVNVKLEAYDAEALQGASVRGDAPRITMNIETGFPGAAGEDGVVEFPGGKFFLDLENLPNLDNVFVDEKNRIFEFKPGHKMRIFERSQEPVAPDDASAEEHRLGKLNRRLKALEAMLDELLKESKRSRDRD